MRGQPRNSSEPVGRACGRLACAGLLLLSFAISGCSTLRLPASQPKARIKSLQLTGKPAGPITYSTLNARVMRFADTYAATIAEACDQISATTAKPEIRLMSLRWKLDQATSAYTDATGQNPAVNTLDILVLASLSRMVVEDYGHQSYGDAVRPLLDAHRHLESNAWTMAEGVLKPAQENELKDLIQEWRRRNPRQQNVGQIRFREFLTGMEKIPRHAKAAPVSIFNLLYIDPMAGLDPTVAAIEETRELGERAVYYSQRLPNLLA
jgi:hypothetical protein